MYDPNDPLDIAWDEAKKGAQRADERGDYREARRLDDIAARYHNAKASSASASSRSSEAAAIMLLFAVGIPVLLVVALVYLIFTYWYFVLYALSSALILYSVFRRSPGKRLIGVLAALLIAGCCRYAQLEPNRALALLGIKLGDSNRKASAATSLQTGPTIVRDVTAGTAALPKTPLVHPRVEPSAALRSAVMAEPLSSQPSAEPTALVSPTTSSAQDDESSQVVSDEPNPASSIVPSPNQTELESATSSGSTVTVTEETIVGTQGSIVGTVTEIDSNGVVLSTASSKHEALNLSLQPAFPVGLVVRALYQVIAHSPDDPTNGRRVVQIWRYDRSTSRAGQLIYNDPSLPPP